MIDIVEPEPPIIEAAKAGDVTRLRGLLDAAPETVNATGWMGITPLIAATWSADSLAAVRLLLERGANPLARRHNGDTAMHWASSGAVAEVLGRAAGRRGLDARYLFNETPLHIAVDKRRADVVRAFLSAGADPGARSKSRGVPLDSADTPEIVRLLVESGAAVHTEREWTPLHRACVRAREDADWVPVVDLLLDHGADPGRRDEFGDTPVDLLGDDGPARVRERILGMLSAAGRAVELTLADAAVGAQQGVAVDPRRAVALTSMYSGAVLVEWRLRPTVEPVRVLRIPGRVRQHGPFGSALGGTVAFVGQHSVTLRDWRNIECAKELPAELLPRENLQAVAWSPDGRLLAISKSEDLQIVDVVAGEVVARADGLDDCALGDWSVRPCFSPDARLLAVGNTMQGSWWQSMLEVSPAPRQRYEREDLPSTRISDLVTSVVFAPDGRRFATWVRPDYGHTGADGYRGMVVTSWAETGEPHWHSHIDETATGRHGESYSAPLCFTADGAWLAIGLDCGVLWLDAETGAVVRMDATEGEVTALACAPHTGLVAASARGLWCPEPPLREEWLREG